MTSATINAAKIIQRDILHGMAICAVMLTNAVGAPQKNTAGRTDAVLAKASSGKPNVNRYARKANLAFIARRTMLRTSASSLRRSTLVFSKLPNCFYSSVQIGGG